MPAAHPHMRMYTCTLRHRGKMYNTQNEMCQGQGARTIYIYTHTHTYIHTLAVPTSPPPNGYIYTHAHMHTYLGQCIEQVKLVDPHIGPCPRGRSRSCCSRSHSRIRSRFRIGRGIALRGAGLVVCRGAVGDCMCHVFSLCVCVFVCVCMTNKNQNYLASKGRGKRLAPAGKSDQPWRGD